MALVKALDNESTRWLANLRDTGATRERAIGRLHAMLLGVARAEAFRRRGALPADIAGDLDDLCMQAANDATTAILGKLDGFRGASRFTTWAYKFAILEVSVRLRRRAWSARRVVLDEVSWGRLADPAQGTEQALEERQLLEAVRKLVATTLTNRQRSIFLAAVADEIPIDVIAERTGSSRGAVYKTLHDARRKLRDSLVAAGHLEAE
jgi:RNA polymerase sigma-70 factor (ECF subfamily)